MKVTIGSEGKGNGVKYPCLMKSEHSGTIVLFTEKSCGVSIVGIMEGHYSTTWVDSSFEPFDKSITLEND
jgi:hypothetical protein